jgi:hypothetical protein
MNDDETRKKVEEDADEDLELAGEDAEKIGGGALSLELDGIKGESQDDKFKGW